MGKVNEKYKSIQIKNNKAKEPKQYKIGDKFGDGVIKKIEGLVNGRCTYATTITVGVEG